MITTEILGAGLVVTLVTLVTLVVILFLRLPQSVATLVAAEITRKLDQGLLAERWAARLSIPAPATHVPASRPAPIASGVSERPTSPLCFPLAQHAQQAGPRSDPSTEFAALLDEPATDGTDSASDHRAASAPTERTPRPPLQFAPSVEPTLISRLEPRPPGEPR